VKGKCRCNTAPLDGFSQLAFLIGAETFRLEYASYGGDEFCSFALTGTSMPAQSVMLNGFSFALSDLSPTSLRAYKSSRRAIARGGSSSFLAVAQTDQRTTCGTLGRPFQIGPGSLGRLPKLLELRPFLSAM
jgi:hypothetical protein